VKRKPPTKSSGTHLRWTAISELERRAAIPDQHQHIGDASAGSVERHYGAGSERWELQHFAGCVARIGAFRPAIMRGWELPCDRSEEADLCGVLLSAPRAQCWRCELLGVRRERLTRATSGAEFVGVVLVAGRDFSVVL
jgi:hypothetical protein